jgi:hypothetical protein
LAQVDTATDLRGIPTALIASGTLFLVTDLEGIYEFDANSLAADNGDAAIKPDDRTTLQAGRWLKNADGLAPGRTGNTGPADNTYTTLAALLASDPTRKSSRLVPEAGETAPAGNFSYLSGAWVRQKADGLTFRRAETGASTRTLQAWAEDQPLSVKDFGAVGDGIADDGPAIRNAIAACGDLRNLIFPIGTYLVGRDGANDWCLRKPASIRFIGSTMGHSVITPSPSIPDTCDAVREIVSNIYANRGGGCADIAIENPTNGTRAGRDGWRVDTSATLAYPDLQINGNVYERLSTGLPTAATPGYGFRHVNGIGNSDGGMYRSVLRECRLAGGFSFEKTGDSISVVDCQTSGPLPNRIEQIVNVGGSANTFTVQRINATNQGGLFQIINAPGLEIARMNGENFAPGAATFNGAAAIWLRGPTAWANATAYTVGSLVSQGTVNYRSLVAHTSVTGTDQPGTGSGWQTKWAIHDPFENVNFHDNLIAIANSFDGTAAVRIDAGNRVSFNRNRMDAGFAGIKSFIVQAAATNVDLRGNTYPPGLPLADRLVNGGVGTIFDSFGVATQATNKGTAVTLNTSSGAITMNAASLAAAASSGFLLLNNLIGPNDAVNVWIRSGASTNSYDVRTDITSMGSVRIALQNISAGALAEAVVLGFLIVNAGA